MGLPPRWATVGGGGPWAALSCGAVWSSTSTQRGGSVNGDRPRAPRSSVGTKGAGLGHGPGAASGVPTSCLTVVEPVEALPGTASGVGLGVVSDHTFPVLELSWETSWSPSVLNPWWWAPLETAESPVSVTRDETVSTSGLPSRRAPAEGGRERARIDGGPPAPGVERLEIGTNGLVATGPRTAGVGASGSPAGGSGAKPDTVAAGGFGGVCTGCWAEGSADGSGDGSADAGGPLCSPAPEGREASGAGGGGMGLTDRGGRRGAGPRGLLSL